MFNAYQMPLAGQNHKFVRVLSSARPRWQPGMADFARPSYSLLSRARPLVQRTRSLLPLIRLSSKVCIAQSQAFTIIFFDLRNVWAFPFE